MPSRWFAFAADVVVAGHFAYMVFVVGGGFLLWRWPWLIWLHVPAVFWGALVELAGWTCPLTPLENDLRALAGGAGYEQDFVMHYLLPVIYPPFFSRAIQIATGLFVVAVNAVAYGHWFWRWRKRGETRISP
jgi:hypothetical protein